VPAGLKTIKGGKTENEFETRRITLRGIEYEITELGVTEYKQVLAASTDKDGFTPFQTLLDNLVVRCVKPSPATRTTPMPYPVYRTLEDIVNTMHFRTLPDEAAPVEPEEADEDAPEEAAPNS
jgi:hypothetical protein